MRKTISIASNGFRLTAWRQGLLVALVAVWVVGETNAAQTMTRKDIIAPRPAISVTPETPTDQDNLVASINYGCSDTAVVYGKSVTINGNMIEILSKMSCEGLERVENPDDQMDLGRLAGGAYQIRLLVQTKGDQGVPYGEVFELAANTFVVSGTPPAGTINMSEFYHAGLNHYFVTGDTGETLLLRTSPQLGWRATGTQFAVLSIDTPLNGSLQQVCRFYGSVTPGPNSHFFTADPAECATLTQRQESTPASLPRWNLEGRVLVVALPGQGACPVEYPQSIRRFYNGRALQNDSNHRYVSSDTIADLMRTDGWVDEGVVMCGAR